MIAAWTATTIKLSVNGGAFVTAADSTNPNLASSTPQIGRRFEGGTGYARWLDGDVLWVAIGSGTLSHATPPQSTASGVATRP